VNDFVDSGDGLFLLELIEAVLDMARQSSAQSMHLRWFLWFCSFRLVYAQENTVFRVSMTLAGIDEHETDISAVPQELTQRPDHSPHAPGL
jgi:hypothetical protein